MGDVWLLDMPEALKDYGLTEEELYLEPGWQTRSRSTGGFEEVLACGIHHDAIATGVPFHSRINSAIGKTWDNPNAPVGNGHVHYDRIGWYCAGASNTQGRSERSFITSKGVIPQSKGNLYVCAWEASNAGTGIPWPENQLRLYDIAMAATADLCDLDYNHQYDLITHHTYTSRKIDPLGPARNYGPGEWNDYIVAQRVLDFMVDNNNPVEIPGGLVLESRRIIDSRVDDPNWHPNADGGYEVPIRPNLPVGTKIAWFTVQINSPVSSGWGKFITTPDVPTLTSDIGWETGQQNHNTVPVGLDVNGVCWLYFSTSGMNFIVDLIGYE